MSEIIMKALKEEVTSLLQHYKEKEALKRAKYRLYRKLWEMKVSNMYSNFCEQEKQFYRDAALKDLLKRRHFKLLKRYQGKYDRAVVEKEDGTKIRYFFYKGWWRKA